ncbi:hypothetical protein FRC01_001104 [Tulasnella sp. 417]|nr:hypothetical protein FRC01_001104 [Tulasnella sp. 417]
MVQKKLARKASPSEAPPRMGVESSRREWALRGKDCFKREDYSNASLAFDRAGLRWWKSVADAFELKKSAEMMPAQDPLRATRFKRAAEDIRACSQSASIPKDKERLTAASANCYVESKNYKLAAELFYELGRYDDATWNYRLAGAFKDAISVIERHREELNPELAQDVKDVAAVVFVRQGEKQEAKSLFDTSEAHMKFLEENGFNKEHADALVDMSQHDAAAEVLLKLGRRVEAVKRLLESGNKAAESKASEYISDGIFMNTSFTQSDCGPSGELPGLIQLAFRVEAAKNILLARPDVLLSQGKQFADNHVHLALLYLDALLSLNSEKPLGEHPEDIDGVIGSISSYVLYGRLIRKTAQLPDLAKHQNLRKLFGLAAQQPSHLEDGSRAPNGVIVLPHSFIYLHACGELSRGKGMKTESGILLPLEAASYHLSEALLARYNSRIDPLIKALDQAKQGAPFTLCIHHVRLGKCTITSCKRYHLKEENLSIQGFNQRINLHLLIIAALEALNKTSGQRRQLQGLWLGRLFETCYPLDNRLGSMAWLQPSLIPQYDMLMSAAKIWCEDLYRTMGRDRTYFLTNAIGCAMFGSTLDYWNTTHYIRRGEWGRASRKSSAHRSLERSLNWFSRRAWNRHNRGVAFIDHVIAKELQMDVSTLISFAEEVIGHLAYNRFRNSENRDRQLLLPQSWLARAVQQGPSKMELGSAPMIVANALSQLLQILQRKDQEGNGQNSAGRAGKGTEKVSENSGENARKPDPSRAHEENPLKLHYRGVPIEKAARTVKNLGGNDLKAEILASFRKFKQVDASPHFVYRGFVEAMNWDAVVKALSAFALGTPQDPLVALHPVVPFRPRDRLAGARVFPWTSKTELLSKLGLTDSALNYATQRHAPAPTREKTSTQISASGLESLSTKETSTVEADNLVPVAWTQEEIEAAQKIVRSYQRYRRRAGGGAGGPLWDAYNERASTLPSFSQSAVVYKFYLRGVMPMVLTYVRRLIDRCEAVNKDLKVKLSSAPHEELDEIRGRIKVVKQLIADAKAVAENIVPEASVHFISSLDVLRLEADKIVPLRERAIEVCPTLKSPDSNYTDGVEFLLMQRKPKPQRRILPTLNTDDIYFGPDGSLG